MPTRLSHGFSLSAALGLALGAAVLTASVPAMASEEDQSWDNKMFRGILEGLGLQRGGPDINYQERAPLVIPPSATLPPPEKSDAVVANNPAWPNDPDVARRKAEQRAERARRSIGAGEQIENDQRVLSEREMTPGSRPTGRRTAAGSDNSKPVNHGYGSQHDNLGGTGPSIFSNLFGRGNDEVASFTGEPPRGSLTDPPRGYQTPSPNQPYGLAKNTTAPKASNDMQSRPEAK